MKQLQSQPYTFQPRGEENFKCLSSHGICSQGCRSQAGHNSAHFTCDSQQLVCIRPLSVEVEQDTPMYKNQKEKWQFKNSAPQPVWKHTSESYLFLLCYIPVISLIAFFVKSFPFMFSRNTVPVWLSLSPEVSVINIGIILPLKISISFLEISFPLAWMFWKMKSK